MPIATEAKMKTIVSVSFIGVLNLIIDKAAKRPKALGILDPIPKRMMVTIGPEHIIIRSSFFD
jgi:hypothetical protein